MHDLEGIEHARRLLGSARRILTLRNPDARLVTQNVDGLHELALEEAVSENYSPEDSARPRVPARPSVPARALPIRLHGSLFHTRCTGCDDRTPDRAPVDAESEASLPRCAKCGALLRPDVVWFGEGLDPGILQQAMARAETAEVCLVVGTSSPGVIRSDRTPCPRHPGTGTEWSCSRLGRLDSSS